MSSTTPKNNTGKSGAAQRRREQRQAEAAERKRLAFLRTPDEQLARLRERGVQSGREFERLVEMVEGGRGKLGNDQYDKIVAEDSSTYPKTRKERKQAKKGAKK
jgi:hypothetical protein